MALTLEFHGLDAEHRACAFVAGTPVGLLARWLGAQVIEGRAHRRTLGWWATEMGARLCQPRTQVTRSRSTGGP